MRPFRAFHLVDLLGPVCSERDVGTARANRENGERLMGKQWGCPVWDDCVDTVLYVQGPITQLVAADDPQQGKRCLR